MAKLDDVCPADVGANNIVLALKKALDTPIAGRPVVITVGLLNEALVAGLVLPLELRIVPPTPSGVRQHFYTRKVPSSFAFTPREGGTHLVVLREIGHQRWSGTLLVTVAGTQLDI